MTVNLNQPLAWKSASWPEVQMLQSLQGNILKGHGRSHVQLLFFRFSELANGPVRGRRLLRSLAQDRISSAYRQLQDAERYKQKGIPSG